MSLLAPAERERLARAVAAAERATAAEFVTVLARRADGYAFIPLAVAGVAALLGAAVALAAWPGLGARELLAVEVAVFAATALALRWPRLLLACVPRAIRRRRARRLARELFLDLGLLNTAERTGVLLFVAAGERHVEIIADRGVAALIDDAAWQAVVDRFVATVKAGAFADGLVAAVEDCGRLLAARLPAAAGDRNELPDRLVEL